MSTKLLVGPNSVIQEGNPAKQQPFNTILSLGANTPFIAVDGAGDVYASEHSQSIVEWNPATQQTTTLVSSGLNAAYGIAVDGAGNVYIADLGNKAIEELPHAFVPTSSFTEQLAAGTDQMLPVLPSSAPITATSDSTWLTIGTISNGFVPFSFSQNTGTTARTAHITVLGQVIAVTQLAIPTVTFTAHQYRRSMDRLSTSQRPPRLVQRRPFQPQAHARFVARLSP